MSGGSLAKRGGAAQPSMRRGLRAVAIQGIRGVPPRDEGTVGGLQLGILEGLEGIVAAGLALQEPAQVVSVAVALEALNFDVLEAGGGRHLFQGLAGVQHQMLAPEGEVAELRQARRIGSGSHRRGAPR